MLSPGGPGKLEEIIIQGRHLKPILHEINNKKPLPKHLEELKHYL